jgi:hypothetical protein
MAGPRIRLSRTLMVPKRFHKVSYLPSKGLALHGESVDVWFIVRKVSTASLRTGLRWRHAARWRLTCRLKCHHQRRDRIFLTDKGFSTVAQLSQCASSTRLYFTSNGFLIAVVRSISWLAACASFIATCTHTSLSDSGI